MRSSTDVPSASTSCAKRALRRSSSSLKAAIRSKRPASSISSPASSNVRQHGVGPRPLAPRGSAPAGGGCPPPPCSAGTRAAAAPAPRAGRRAPRRPAASVGSIGTSIFDLMWMSVAAITMNSPATSRFSSCIRSRYSMYWRVMGAIGMSWMSIFSRRIRYSRRSSGPSKSGRWICGASSGRIDSMPSGTVTRSGAARLRRAAGSTGAGGSSARPLGFVLVAHGLG